MAALIQKRSDMQIKSEKNYLKHIKQSGYRSYHLIIYYTVETIEGPKTIQAEIQIRTMAMDSWSALEHQLIYKNPCAVAEIDKDLKHWADELAKQDRKLVEFRKRIASETKYA